MYKIAVATSLLMLLTLTSCGGSNTSDTNINNSVTTKSISMKAGIVYNVGGPQPVARVPFYLLREDLDNIMGSVGLAKKYPDGSGGGAVTFGIIMMDGSDTQGAAKMMALLQPYIVTQATTDFDGAARFEGLGSGPYYLVGMTQTRGGFAVWNLKVNAGDTVMLDQNNAAYAR